MWVHVSVSNWTLWPFSGAWLNKDTAVFLPLFIFGSLAWKSHNCYKSSFSSSVDMTTGPLWIFYAYTTLYGSVLFGFTSEFKRGFDFSGKYITNKVITQQSLMPATIIMWQFCSLIIFLTNTRSHNNSLYAWKTWKHLYPQGKQRWGALLIHWWGHISTFFISSWKAVWPLFWHIDQLLNFYCNGKCGLFKHIQPHMSILLYL